MAAATRPEISFSAYLGPSRDIVLSFDHLDHKDGATIEILHTGPDPYSIRLSGDVIGTQGRLSRVESPLWDDPGGFKGAILIGAAIFAFALFEGIKGQLVYAAGWLLASLVVAGLAFKSRQSDRRRLPTALWRDVPGGLPFAVRHSGR